MKPTAFASLGLTAELAYAASASGFDIPTPIQVAAIPSVLQGADVLVSAETGSGKTAAFALPILQLLQRQPRCTSNEAQALVLVPTRELAAQTGEVFRRLAQHLPQPLKIAVAFGGVSINPQMMSLRAGVNLLIATPGRLLDLVEHNALKLTAVNLLVLDEADRLLEPGFADELNRVLSLLPVQRQTLLFSATFPPVVQALSQSLLRDPLRIEITGPQQGASPVPSAILQRVIQVDAAQRTVLLRHLIKTHAYQRVLVFVATQYAAEHVAEKLYKAGIFAAPFHGGLSQGARTQVLSEFKASRWDVVVTTDLASRGIDIAQLPVVINYDLPRSAVDYIHRIGRTGRAGEVGLAISLVSAATEPHFRLIEKRQHLSLPREQIAGYEPTQAEPVPLDLAPVTGAGGIKGKRPSKKDKLRAAKRQNATPI
ncbi:MAG: DEAD/DEAH box helicase [Burkholderiales bacterium]